MKKATGFISSKPKKKKYEKKSLKKTSIEHRLIPIHTKKPIQSHSFIKEKIMRNEKAVNFSHIHSNEKTHTYTLIKRHRATISMDPLFLSNSISIGL